MFGWPNDVGLWVLLAALLSFLVEHDRRPGLGNIDEVDELDCGPKNELNPEVPSPVKELLDRATANATDD